MTLPRTSKGRESARDLSRSAGGPLPAANHAPAPHPATTRAGDWWNARLEGRRLPEHELEEAIVQHNFNQEHAQ